jgi:hypothetical protein
VGLAPLPAAVSSLRTVGLQEELICVLMFGTHPDSLHHDWFATRVVAGEQCDFERRAVVEGRVGVDCKKVFVREGPSDDSRVGADEESKRCSWCPCQSVPDCGMGHKVVQEERGQNSRK